MMITSLLMKIVLNLIYAAAILDFLFLRDISWKKQIFWGLLSPFTTQGHYNCEFDVEGQLEF